jgi:hypothetical protein
VRKVGLRQRVVGQPKPLKTRRQAAIRHGLFEAHVDVTAFARGDLRLVRRHAGSFQFSKVQTTRVAVGRGTPQWLDLCGFEFILVAPHGSDQRGEYPMPGG